MTEPDHICPECGRKMMGCVNIETQELVWMCLHCGNPCRGCPKEKTCEDTYGPDCTYERVYNK